MNYGAGFAHQQASYVNEQPGSNDMYAPSQAAPYPHSNAWVNSASGNTQVPLAGTSSQQYPTQLDGDGNLANTQSGSRQSGNQDVMAQIRQFKEKLDALQAGGAFQGYYPSGGHVSPPWVQPPVSQPQQLWIPPADPHQQPVWTAPTAQQQPPAQGPPSASQIPARRGISTGLPYPPMNPPQKAASPSRGATRTGGSRASGPSSSEASLPAGFRSQTVARDPTDKDVTVQMMFSGEIEFVVVHPTTDEEMSSF